MHDALALPLKDFQKSIAHDPRQVAILNEGNLIDFLVFYGLRGNASQSQILVQVFQIG